MKDVLTPHECVGILLGRVKSYIDRGADGGSAVRLTAYDFDVDAVKIERLWLDHCINDARSQVSAHGESY